eukprot:2508218-Rhodomonas_salina.3
MAARPYRRVVWAISRALDHAGDAVREPDCFMKFEWGWLKSEGCLRIPRWMKRLTMIPGYCSYCCRVETQRPHVGHAWERDCVT